jgi:hypothetical protein
MTINDNLSSFLSFPQNRLESSHVQTPPRIKRSRSAPASLPTAEGHLVPSAISPSPTIIATVLKTLPKEKLIPQIPKTVLPLPSFKDQTRDSSVVIAQPMIPGFKDQVRESRVVNEQREQEDLSGVNPNGEIPNPNNPNRIIGGTGQAHL